MTVSSGNLQDVNEYLHQAIDGDALAGERVAYALSHGADVCARKDEVTPLMRAARDGNLVAARALLTQRVPEQISALDIFNRHALFNVLCTPRRHFHELAELLITAGADLSHRDVFGNAIIDYTRAGKFVDEHPEDAAWLCGRLSRELVPQIVAGPVLIPKNALRPGVPKR